MGQRKIIIINNLNKSPAKCRSLLKLECEILLRSMGALVRWLLAMVILLYKTSSCATENEVGIDCFIQKIFDGCDWSLFLPVCLLVGKIYYGSLLLTLYMTSWAFQSVWSICPVKFTFSHTSSRQPALQSNLRWLTEQAVLQSPLQWQKKEASTPEPPPELSLGFGRVIALVI